MAKKLESSQGTAKCIKKSQETQKLYKLIYWDTRGQSYHQASSKENKIKDTEQDQLQTSIIKEDTPHIEEFRCLASKFKCTHCHKFGHFIKLCYEKKESEYKKNTRKPRAHQLMVGRASAVCGQSDASFSSSDDSFCLQMQVKSAQEKTKMNKWQHLVTNIEYKLKPHRRRTKFLRPR